MARRARRVVARPDPALGQGSPPLVAGDLVLDPNTREVTLRGRPVELTTKEFELLRLMMAHPNRVFSRDALLEHIWGYDYFGSSRTVDMHISRLRDKIEDDPASPTYIVTVRGVGYKFKPQDPGARRVHKTTR